MRFRPKISLHGSGEVVELSNGSHADFTLMQGASGLGMRPREITTVALPSGGSLVQHRKGLEADVQIPVLLGGSERQRWDLRRKLERLVRDEVEIRVTRPNGVYRSRFGFYKAGLEGEYGAGEDSPNGQKLVLEFTCPEGMWKGEQQDPEFRLAGIRKRFLSERAVPSEGDESSKYQSPFFPVLLASSTVQGEIDVNIGGDAPVYPTWIIDGPGSDLIIENDKGDSLKVLTEFEEQVTITTGSQREDITSPSMPDGELWEHVPTTSKFFALEPGMNKLKVSMVGAKPNSRVQCLYRENFWAGW
jgi:hypothetical protein